MKKFLVTIVLLFCSIACLAQDLSGSGMVIYAGDFPLAAAGASTTSLSFGSLTIGATSATQSVTFTSVGNASVSISNISVGTSSFKIISNTCGNLLFHGTSCIIMVAFTPQTVGAASDTLTILSNSSGNPDTIVLSGTGTAVGATSAASISATALTFPQTITGNSSATQTVTLTSSGSGTLTITSITLTGTNASEFSKTTTCGGTLATTLACNVVVTFSPTTAGAKSATLVFTTNSGSSPDNVALTGTAILAGGSGFTLSPVFGMTQNNTGVTPAVQFGIRRIHDSPPLNWPAINTALHTYNWTSLDAQLQLDFDNGILEEEFQIGRTPPWATSWNTAIGTGKCSYENTALASGQTDSNGKGQGECYTPIDLNLDGSGTNIIWTTWNVDLEAHVHDAAYLAGTGVWAAHGANCNRSTACRHSLVKYIQPWNEPDTGVNNGKAFYLGSIAQLARLVEDAACAWTGSQSGRRVIHKSQPATTATACAATPVLNTSLIVMPPTHGKGVSVTYTQAELYCNNSSTLSAFQLPCPVVLNAMATQIDIVAEHFKPGAEGTTAHTCGPTGTSLCSIETALQFYFANIESVLANNSPTLTDKSFWIDEGGIAPGQWTDASSTAYIDVDMQKSFYPRYYLMSLSLGMDAIFMYTYDSMVGTGLSATHGGQTGALTSYTASQTFITGAVLTSPCAVVTGQVWACTLTKGGNTYKVMWDASKSCTGGTCTTGSQAVTGFTHQQDFTDSTDIPHTFTSPIQLGIKAKLFSN